MQQRRRRGEGWGGGCCLGDISAITGLAGGTGDVTHLQAFLLSFELRLRDGERQAGRKLRRSKCAAPEDDCRYWINAKELFFFFCGGNLRRRGTVKALPADAKRQRDVK